MECQEKVVGDCRMVGQFYPSLFGYCEDYSEILGFLVLNKNEKNCGV